MTDLPILNSKPSYWQTQDSPLFPDLAWNIPEQDMGRLAIVGGGAQNFASPIKIAEYASGGAFPFDYVTTILPDAVKIPKLPGLEFVPSTKSGSFGDLDKLQSLIATEDYALLTDIGKNSETKALFSKLIKTTSTPLVITRDAVETIAGFPTTTPITIVATLAQLQKLLRDLYYPKMLMLSMPLLAVLDVLHKFTLSYPNLTILTFHDGLILTATAGKIISTPIEKTAYTPLTLWQGQAAVRALGFELYNPGNSLAAITASLFYTA